MSDDQATRNAVLFLCVANSARSQMAEALARSMAPAGVDVFSAGSEPDRVNPYAVRALKEIGLDTRGHRSKSVNEIEAERVRIVVTLCAEEVCPAFMIEGAAAEQVVRLHWPHPDPATAEGADTEVLASFVTVRDQIQQRLRLFFSDATLFPDAPGASARI